MHSSDTVLSASEVKIKKKRTRRNYNKQYTSTKLNIIAYNCGVLLLMYFYFCVHFCVIPKLPSYHK